MLEILNGRVEAYMITTKKDKNVGYYICSNCGKEIIVRPKGLVKPQTCPKCKLLFSGILPK